MTTLRDDNIRAYATAWLADTELPVVSDPERQVAMVLVGYDTPTHGALAGVTEHARRFVAEHYPNGLGR